MPLPRRPLRDLPDGTRFRGRFLGEDEDGQEFEVVVSETSRRVGPGELVRRHVQAASRGMPMHSSGMYDRVHVALVTSKGRRLASFERGSDGAWRSGRLHGRTLKAAVQAALDAAFPRPSGSGGPSGP